MSRKTIPDRFTISVYAEGYLLQVGCLPRRGDHGNQVPGKVPGYTAAFFKRQQDCAKINIELAKNPLPNLEAVGEKIRELGGNLR